MDKNLALAFEFSNAPKDLKEAGIAHRENYFRLKKAEAQFSLWNKEVEAAKVEFNASLSKFNSALDAWKPDETLEEIPVTNE